MRTLIRPAMRRKVALYRQAIAQEAQDCHYREGPRQCGQCLHAEEPSARLPGPCFCFELCRWVTAAGGCDRYRRRRPWK